MKMIDNSFTVAEVIQSLIDAWNRRDAMAFKNLFSKDANYITGDGRWLKGHRPIADLCSERSESVSLVDEPSITLYGDVAIATFRWSIENKPVGGIITLVVNRDWKIETLQNTDLR
jgi:hypothetical protein